MARYMSEDAIKHKRQYDLEYQRKHRMTLHLDFPIEECKDIKKTIKDHGFTYNEFIRLCVKLLKEGKIKRD